ncbi:242_t:CDS:2, partial [Gigaspora rosea]
EYWWVKVISSETHSEPETNNFDRAAWILASGIRKNCKAFQKTLELLDRKSKTKNLDKEEVTEVSNDT